LSKETKEFRSTGSQLVLVFNSIVYDQYTTPSNFKANYAFYTEYGIEGTRAYQNRTCLYTYNSESVSHGNINSPRYPSNYPLNLKCEYVFDIMKNERILFTFKDFKLSSPNSNVCNEKEDFLAFYQHHSWLQNSVLLTEDVLSDMVLYNPAVYRNKNMRLKSLVKSGLRRSAEEEEEWSLLSRYCASGHLPPPFITDENAKKVKLIFNSDLEGYAQGFNLNYNYVRLPGKNFFLCFLI
jgi:hypothetical protein